MNVKLVHNESEHSVPVTLGTGQKINLSIYPHEALIDSSGNVHALVMTFNDGSVGNFQLLPRKDRNQIADFVADFLAPLGLGIVAGRIFRFKGAAGKEKVLVNNVCGFIFNNRLTAMIRNVLDEFTPSHLAYIAMDNHEEVITHPIRLTEATKVDRNKLTPRAGQ